MAAANSKLRLGLAGAGIVVAGAVLLFAPVDALELHAMRVAAAGFAFAAAAWIAFRQPWKTEERVSRWGGAVAVSGAYLLGHLLVRGFPDWNPSDPTDWPFWLAVGSLLVGFFDAAREWPRWARLIPRTILSLVAAYVLLDPEWREEPLKAWESWWLGDDAKLMAVAGVAALLMTFWTVLDDVCERSRAVAPALAVIAFGASAVMVHAGSAVLATLAGPVAAALGAAVVLPLLATNLKSPVPERTAMPAVSILVLATLASGRTMASLSGSSLLLFLIAPAPLLLLRTKLKPGLRAGLAIGGVVILVAIAYGLAWQDVPAEDPGDPYYDY